MSLSVVNFKMHHGNQSEAIHFHGNSIKLLDLKKEILDRKKLSGSLDFDLSVVDENGKAYTEDDEPVPKNSFVVVKRIPVSKNSKASLIARIENRGIHSGYSTVSTATQSQRNTDIELPMKDITPQPITKHPEIKSESSFLQTTRTNPEFISTNPALPSSSNFSSSNPSMIPNNQNATPVEEDEEAFDFENEEISLVRQDKASGLVTRPGMNPPFGNESSGVNGRMNGRGRGRTMDRGRGNIRPSTYPCGRCGKIGHYIQHCPTIGDPAFDRDMHLINVPMASRKKVETLEGVDTSNKTYVQNTDGTYTIFAASQVGFEKLARERLAAIQSLPTIRCLTEENDSEATISAPIDMKEVPDHLKCALNPANFLKEAVTLPCCKKSVNDSLIQQELLKSGLKCPLCGTENITTDSLIIRKDIRDAVDDFIRSKSSTHINKENTFASPGEYQIAGVNAGLNMLAMTNDPAGITAYGHSAAMKPPPPTTEHPSSMLPKPPMTLGTAMYPPQTGIGMSAPYYNSMDPTADGKSNMMMPMQTPAVATQPNISLTPMPPPNAPPLQHMYHNAFHPGVYTQPPMQNLLAPTPQLLPVVPVMNNHLMNPAGGLNSFQRGGLYSLDPNGPLPDINAIPPLEALVPPLSLEEFLEEQEYQRKEKSNYFGYRVRGRGGGNFYRGNNYQRGRGGRFNTRDRDYYSEGGEDSSSEYRQNKETDKQSSSSNLDNSSRHRNDRDDDHSISGASRQASRKSDDVVRKVQSSGRSHSSRDRSHSHEKGSRDYRDSDRSRDRRYREPVPDRRDDYRTSERVDRDKPARGRDNSRERDQYRSDRRPYDEKDKRRDRSESRKRRDSPRRLDSEERHSKRKTERLERPGVRDRDHRNPSHDRKEKRLEVADDANNEEGRNKRSKRRKDELDSQDVDRDGRVDLGKGETRSDRSRPESRRLNSNELNSKESSRKARGRSPTPERRRVDDNAPTGSSSYSRGGDGKDDDHHHRSDRMKEDADQVIRSSRTDDSNDKKSRRVREEEEYREEKRKTDSRDATTEFASGRSRPKDIDGDARDAAKEEVPRNRKRDKEREDIDLLDRKREKKSADDRKPSKKDDMITARDDRGSNDRNKHTVIHNTKYDDETDPRHAKLKSSDSKDMEVHPSDKSHDSKRRSRHENETEPDASRSGDHRSSKISSDNNRFVYRDEKEKKSIPSTNEKVVDSKEKSSSKYDRSDVQSDRDGGKGLSSSSRIVYTEKEASSSRGLKSKSDKRGESTVKREVESYQHHRPDQRPSSRSVFSDDRPTDGDNVIKPLAHERIVKYSTHTKSHRTGDGQSR